MPATEVIASRAKPLSAMSKSVRRLAVCGVFTLICFLAFSSQYLFTHIDPQSLQGNQSIRFNILIASLLVCFARVCYTHRGSSSQIPQDRLDLWSESRDQGRVRFCRKCNRPKPDRWHHCKTCGSCIPKMDHHCIWVNNCVSHRTFPHFIRFLLYSVIAVCYLQYFLFIRFKVLWDNRNLPHYLGPSPAQFIHLLILGFASFFAHFTVSILLLYSAYGLLMNVTTIEGWEIERHEALVERARRHGGYVYGPGGIEVRIRRQEFPYDVGLWRNVSLAMGSSNPLSWFWPFASTPSVRDALDWEMNDFEDKSLRWPPPDPEKMSQVESFKKTNELSQTPDYAETSQLKAFRKRQALDVMRQRNAYSTTAGTDDYNDDDDANLPTSGPSWTNTEGERLEDFGVDTMAEQFDEDDVPLSQLIHRRNHAHG